MTKTLLGAPLLLLLAATSALGQDFAGSYDLTGRYSTRRATEVKVEISRTTLGLKVVRSARFTGWRFRNEPSFTWTSTDTKQAGRLLRVTYTLDKDGKDLGLVQRLDPDRDPGGATVRAVRRASVLTAYYRIGSTGRLLKELVVNTTRRSSESWWYWIRTEGKPKVVPAPSGFLDGFKDRGITDPSLYYYFGVQPKTLRGIRDRDATEGLMRDPGDPTLRRIALMRTMIWELALRWRLDSSGRITPQAGGQWRVGSVVDPNDGTRYDVVHWQDIDDNSFSCYWLDGELFSVYYEN